MSKKVFKYKLALDQAQDEADSTIGTVMVHKPKARKPISPTGFQQSCNSAFKPVATPHLRLSTGSSSTDSSQPPHSPPQAYSPSLMTEGWEVVHQPSHGSNSSPRSALTSQLGKLKIHNHQHFPSLPKDTTDVTEFWKQAYYRLKEELEGIEKVGSDGSKEETEVEAARRQQRLTLIASARGDGGSKNGGQYVPVHHSVIPTPSEQLQLTLTLSAQTKIQKETSQMRTSIISTLRSQPCRHQQWLPQQPQQHAPPSTGTIPRRQEQAPSSLPPLPDTFAGDEAHQLSVHLLQEFQDREMVMAARKAVEDQKKADILMIPSRSSPTGAPSTGHSSPPPPQQKQTGAKTEKKRKKAELIPAKFVTRGFTKELIVESTIDDFNALLESNPDITDELKEKFRDWRRKGKNRTAASKSRDRKIAATEMLRQTVQKYQKQKKIIEARSARYKEEHRQRQRKKDKYEKMIKIIADMRHQQPQLFKIKWESLREDKRQQLLVEFSRLGLL